MPNRAIRSELPIPSGTRGSSDAAPLEAGPPDADRENQVRTEMAICLDFLGKPDLAELERMAVTDGLDDRSDC